MNIRELSTVGFVAAIEFLRRSLVRTPWLRRFVPQCEALESLALLSTITQTLTVPAQFTNFQDVSFATALNRFDPALGTLTSVTVTSGVAVNTTLGVANINPVQVFNDSASAVGVYHIDGLSHVIAGSGSANAAFNSTELAFGATGGVEFVFAVSDVKSATSAFPSDLAFFTASPGVSSSIVPTATIAVTTHVESSGASTTFESTSRAAAMLIVTYDYIPTTVSQNSVAANRVSSMAPFVVHSTGSSLAQKSLIASQSHHATAKALRPIVIPRHPVVVQHPLAIRYHR